MFVPKITEYSWNSWGMVVRGKELLVLPTPTIQEYSVILGTNIKMYISLKLNLAYRV